VCTSTPCSSISRRIPSRIIKRWRRGVTRFRDRAATILFAARFVPRGGESFQESSSSLARAAETPSLNGVRMAEKSVGPSLRFQRRGSGNWDMITGSEFLGRGPRRLAIRLARRVPIPLRETRSSDPGRCKSRGSLLEIAANVESPSRTPSLGRAASTLAAYRPSRGNAGGGEGARQEVPI